MIDIRGLDSRFVIPLVMIFTLTSYIPRTTTLKWCHMYPFYSKSFSITPTMNMSNPPLNSTGTIANGFQSEGFQTINQHLVMREASEGIE
jgi:hypothetical protein